MKRNIKFLVMDVDGTLTDGKIYMGEKGELFKAFNIKDGCGIKDILPQYKILPVVITARESKIVEKRCMELGIRDLYQGVRNKQEVLYAVIKNYSQREKACYSFENVAYIGDDLLDLLCMKAVKAAKGLVGCPLDAAGEVRNIADYVTAKNGGNGAVREFIEWLIQD